MKSIIESAPATENRNKQSIKQRVHRFTALATVLAALTLGAPSAAGEVVPFKGRSAGIITNVGYDPVANVVRLLVVGAGLATRLGHFTLDATVEISLVNGTVRQEMVLTAANGDMLVLTGDGGQGIDPTHAVGTLTVAGGTGRFDGATGYVNQIITFAIAPPTFDPNPYTDVFEGTLSFERK